MAKESKIIWLVIALILLFFIVICIGGAYYMHFRDHKEEEKWRSKYMAERMEQIE